jgi:hypothetical protein
MLEGSLMKYLPFACTSLVDLVDDDVLRLHSLATTHGEASLPTSTSHRGGLQEVGVREKRA